MEIWKEIKRLSGELAEEVTNLRRDFHQHPELSHQEERTARVVARICGTWVWRSKPALPATG
jgi:metal-dependent amidase/aminoacylase/carboxypeptidase family protein